VYIGLSGISTAVQPFTPTRTFIFWTSMTFQAHDACASMTRQIIMIFYFSSCITYTYAQSINKNLSNITHILNFSFFFGIRTGLAIQSRCWISLTKPVAKNLDSSSPMARRFSWLKRHRPCLTGFEPGLLLTVCSVTSWETPDISSELHTNMSLLHQRKSTSSLSYLGFKLALI
jgi:hypothetical protein